MDEFLVVRNWGRFQHYKNPRPIWVKLYRDILGDYEFSQLGTVERWTLVGLWLLAAETDNKIPHDSPWIQRRLQLEAPPNLTALQKLGFITVMRPMGRNPEIAENGSKPGETGKSLSPAQLIGVSDTYTPSREGLVPEEKRREEKSKRIDRDLIHGKRDPEGENGNFCLEIETPESEPPEITMHRIWHEVFGYDGRRLQLTPTRSQKYRLMYREQLADTPDPMAAWRAVLFAVSCSAHHMGNRAYLMPESLLLNQERRDRWVQKAMEAIQDGPQEGERKLKGKAVRLLEYLEKKSEARL